MNELPTEDNLDPPAPAVEMPSLAVMPDHKSDPPAYLGLLQLLRIPNLFTSFADVTMGYLLVRGGLHEPARFFLLLASSSALYLAGMVLNDVYDHEVDARERPHRPIPSGRITLRFARKLGFGLILLGLVCAVGACFVIGSLRPAIVAGLLALCVWLYDGVLKRTPLAPLLMGSCRMLNVLLAMSADPAPWKTFNWVVAGGVGVYITGVTWFARREAGRSSQFQLASGMFIALAGMFLLARVPNIALDGQLPSLMDLGRWYQLWIFMAVMIGWRMVRAVLTPVPQMVQPAVKVALLSLIMLDAAITLGWLGLGGPGNVPWVILIMCLSIPALFLGRWVYST